MLSRRSLLAVGAATMTGLGIGACGSSSNPMGSAARSSTPEDDSTIATDAYVFGYPLVLMDATRATAGARNRLDHAESLPTPADRQLPRPNMDTLYSQARLDLRAEPMVLQVPAMESGRYWLMQVVDAWSNTVHDPSSVDPDIRPGASAPPYTYALTGPGWTGTLPDGITPLPMPTNTAWLIGRIQVNGESDLAGVHAFQQQMKLTHLSKWGRGGGDRGPAGGEKSISPAAEVAQMDGRTFFDRLVTVMMTSPPTAADAAAMQRFAKIGLAPGHLPTVPKGVLDEAVRHGQRQIADYHDPTSKRQNGWNFPAVAGTYGTDYLRRANIALLGLGVTVSRDVVYPTLFGTADNNGAPRRFRLRFPPGQLPPVDAFWSLTAYDPDSFLIDNPANIYAVGHQTPVVADPDGSVEIAIQSEDPGTGVPQGNWLPIPAGGRFSLTMRLYAPKPEVLDGGWQPPALTTL